MPCLLPATSPQTGVMPGTLGLRLEGGPNITNCDTFDDVINKASAGPGAIEKPTSLSPILCWLNPRLQP